MNRVTTNHQRTFDGALESKLIEQFPRRADARDMDMSKPFRGRWRRKASLRRDEGYRVRRTHRRTERPAGVAVEPRWDIDRKHVLPARIDGGDHVIERGPHRAA